MRADKSSGINCRESSLAMPPCTSGESFEKVYDVILLLDDRENFGSVQNILVLFFLFHSMYIWLLIEWHHLIGQGKQNIIGHHLSIDES